MSTTITLEPKTTMPSIAPLYQVAMDALAAVTPGGRIIIDASALEEGDLSLVQLIEATRRDGAARGVDVALSAPANGVIAALARRVGLAMDDPGNIGFWFHGETTA
jgi:hypothetical protein